MNNKLSNIIIWAKNKPGVLYRILGLFRRKMLNVESATAGHTETPGISRITITVTGKEEKIANMCQQVEKLFEVIKVENPTSQDLVVRELALIKIGVKSKSEKNEVLRMIDHFRGRVVHMASSYLVIEVSGKEEKIDAFYENLKVYKILEFVRTGRTALFK